MRTATQARASGDDRWERGHDRGVGWSKSMRFSASVTLVSASGCPDERYPTLMARCIKRSMRVRNPTRHRQHTVAEPWWWPWWLLEGRQQTSRSTAVGCGGRKGSSFYLSNQRFNIADDSRTFVMWAASLRSSLNVTQCHVSSYSPEK